MAVVVDEASDKLRFRPSLKALADAASASHSRAAALLVLLCLIAFLPGFFGIPPVDRDEARFAQATKQMLETGNYVDIRFQDEARYKKPIGIYWLQAAVVRLGEAVGVPRALNRIWLYRFPSLFGAIGAVLATYWTALAFVSRRAAFMAALMMATSISLGIEARLAKTDAMLLLTIVAAMGALGRTYLAGRGAASGSSSEPWTHAATEWSGPSSVPSPISSWRLPAIFWTAIAGGILLKGPVIVMFVGLAAIALVAVDRSAAWLKALRPLAGIAWTLALVLPWFIAIVIKSGDQFFAESLGHDLFAKLGSGQESHGGPPGTYFVMFWVMFFPGAMLAALTAPAVWRARASHGARFLLAWIIPSWLVLEIVATKLPHYVLPIYPAIAILIAGAIDSKALSHQRWLRAGPAFWFLVSIALGVLAIAVHVEIGGEVGLRAWPFLIAAAIVALFAWRLFAIDGAERSLLRAAVVAILIGWGVFGATLASIPQLFPAQDLAKFVRFTAKCDDPQVATAGYHEPSLVFLTGTSLRHTDGAGAAEFLGGGGCRFAFVEARQDRSFAQRAEALGVRYTKAYRVEGINISGGRSIAVTVYRASQ